MVRPPTPLFQSLGTRVHRGGRVVRWCWVNFQCRGVLLILIVVGQGPITLAIGAGGDCLDIFSLVYHFSFLSSSLWETARYRLKYFLKGPLSPKPTNNQPTRSFTHILPHAISEVERIVAPRTVGNPFAKAHGLPLCTDRRTMLYISIVWIIILLFIKCLIIVKVFCSLVDFGDNVSVEVHFIGRFLPFRRYHNFANSFSKLSESTFYKEISKFQ